jgi:hypothetical protein
MKRRALRRFMTQLMQWIARVGAWMVGAALGFAALGLFAVIVASVLNQDFHTRSPQVITLRAEEGAERSDLKVRVVVHRLLVEENAVEVSLVVEARYGSLPKEVKDETPCLTLVYADGFEPDTVSKTLDITCRRFEVPGKSIGEVMSAETPRFMLSAAPSVGAYPFDDWEFIPVVSLLARANWPAAAVYSVERRVPGKELRVTGDASNWQIHLRRPFAERALVLAVGIAFLALTLLIASKLFARDGSSSGTQDLLALAGFVVAIASLRDMLGVSRATGVSTWEIVVIGIPMIALCVGMSYSAFVRPWMEKSKSHRTGSD